MLGGGLVEGLGDAAGGGDATCFCSMLESVGNPGGGELHLNVLTGRLQM
jgi:hypothetical protein